MPPYISGAWRGSLFATSSRCIALDVRADIGEQLVIAAGLFFRRNSEDELLHALLFETKDLSVARANEIMEQAGMPKLTYGEGE